MATDPIQSWRASLRHELDQRRDAGLLRSLSVFEPADEPGLVRRVGTPAPLLNLASNDYLALSQHPRLIAAATQAVGRFGTGSGASRLVTGTGPLHAQAEREFAHFKHADAALLFPTGYMANLAVLATLVQAGDLVCLDKLNHASLLDAARATGAQVRVFPHRDTRKLERLLASHADASAQSTPATGRAPQRFIVTDSVFSMDGDCADLHALIELRNRYHAILVIDEAHGTGVLGPGGAGLAEHLGVSEQVDVTVSTASKALGSLGGIVTASRVVIDTLINAGRSFIYTTGVPPAQAASILAALEVVRDEPDRRARLTQLSLELRAGIAHLSQRGGQSASLHTPALQPGEPATPIVPLIVGDEHAALTLAAHLETRGFLAPAIRPPTVARGTSRLRLTLRADMKSSDLSRLLDALSDWPR